MSVLFCNRACPHREEHTRIADCTLRMSPNSWKSFAPRFAQQWLPAREPFTATCRPARLDFDAADGSYYLGGLRFSIHPNQPESFLTQTDWLQIAVDPTTLPSPPQPGDLTDADGNPIDRFDLVYLRGWEQNVTATEDSELLERALGGPDTSVYRRRMRRLEVLTDGPGDCADAIRQLVEASSNP